MKSFSYHLLIFNHVKFLKFNPNLLPRPHAWDQRGRAVSSKFASPPLMPPGLITLPSKEDRQ
jgi:hypothetical protein